MGGEGGDQVERAPLAVVAFAPRCRLGIGGEALGDEGVVAGGEGPLVCWPESFEAAPAGVGGCPVQRGSLR